MDKVKQVGKSFRTSHRETAHNTRRMAENFLKPERSVGAFNKLHPYKKEFTADGAIAKLNLQISPLTVPCTINPPILGISCFVTFASDNPGYCTTPFSSTQSLIPGTNDFTLVFNSVVDSGIQVPVDGCYSVLWQSPAWGVGYFGDKTVTVGITHNGKAVRLIYQKTTGAIIILGPTIYVYTPASPVYAVVECKAGDIIGAFMTENDVSQGYPWLGHPEGLQGFFYTGNPSSLNIELIAVAEG